MEARLCRAVDHRYPVSFQYQDENLTVFPHALGTTTAGNLAIRAYLSNGRSKSRDEPPWRLYRLDRMKRVTVHSSRKFTTRPMYRSNDKGLTLRCRIRNSRR